MSRAAAAAANVGNIVCGACGFGVSLYLSPFLVYSGFCGCGLLATSETSRGKILRALKCDANQEKGRGL